MDEAFYITTPIYYVNDVPHIGHAYTTILADVLARFARLRGQETFFLTGTDEHGQKVQDAAQERGIAPQDQADAMVVRFQQAWERLHVSHDDFIRTTQPRHERVVTAILQDLWERGEIYLGSYEGWYCVSDERFWTEKDLIDGNCPDCGRPVERLQEPNYFFRMSAYREWLVDYILAHPSFIRPENRRNEVLGFLRRPLGDLCISRPVERLRWGIPLPFDAGYVTYVWFDALINYITAIGYLVDEARFARLWSQARHLIGKDILITHAVYWPTMLQAIGLPQPQTIFAHGWWVSGGAKMSKSIGNVVDPLAMAVVYGVDAFRYFLMRDMVPGRDADFDESSLRKRYQADLANDLGNLLHRLINMIGRYCDGRIPKVAALSSEDIHLRERCLATVDRTFSFVETLALNEAMAHVMALIGDINRYLERTTPWMQARQSRTERVGTILYCAAEALRVASILLQPVMPERMAELWHRLGWQSPEFLRAGLDWGLLRPGTPVVMGKPLFPRDILVE